MRHVIATLVALSLVCCGHATAWACMWDYDTLKMERTQFPNALELITGKFLRHSHDFYRWRIQDRQKRMAKEPGNLALYDDLAVAYDKLGAHAKAIALMKQKEKKKPGQYETYANLGTFYIHNGQLSEGLEYIEKAIKINPNAHFGREIYQAHLVSYILFVSGKKKPKLPLSHTLYARISRGTTNPMEKALMRYTSDFPFKSFLFDLGFRTFLEQGARIKAKASGKKLSDKEQTKADEKLRKDAVKGVLGMMRFGNYRSPILLEALGDLLRMRGSRAARRLATRAYLSASFNSTTKAAKEGYFIRAKYVLDRQRVSSNNQTPLTLIAMQKVFKTELKEADAWWKRTIEADEKRWIAEGINPEKAFDRKYYKSGMKVQVNKPWRLGETTGKGLIVVLVAFGVLFFLWRRSAA